MHSVAMPQVVCMVQKKLVVRPPALGLKFVSDAVNRAN